MAFILLLSQSICFQSVVTSWEQIEETDLSSLKRRRVRYCKHDEMEETGHLHKKEKATCSPSISQTPFRSEMTREHPLSNCHREHYNLPGALLECISIKYPRTENALFQLPAESVKCNVLTCCGEEHCCMSPPHFSHSFLQKCNPLKKS